MIASIFRKPKKKAKKIIRWGKGLVVFVTTEAKELGWNDRTLVAVSINDDRKFIKLEKIAEI